LCRPPRPLPECHERDRQNHEVVDAAVETLPGQCGQLDFGDVEPGAVFGGVVDFQALGEGEGFVTYRAFGTGSEL
jgi:hypothetical protein